MLKRTSVRSHKSVAKVVWVILVQCFVNYLWGTTLEAISKYSPPVPVLSLFFNRKDAE